MIPKLAFTTATAPLITDQLGTDFKALFFLNWKQLLSGNHSAFSECLLSGSNDPTTEDTEMNEAVFHP